MRRYIIRTLQDLVDHEMQLTAHCGSAFCGHHKVLDLKEMIATFGPDYSCIGDDRLRNAIRCERCGHKGGSVTISVVTKTQHVA
ncbi:hypothetical protein [Chelativorans sp.]|uniref:hypothetical protein n=1 Tax=Chelativorans sp. TaxID=2203393 RepID=UPI0028113344|nr:hypothetical protein [Chelativorans sp.]